MAFSLSFEQAEILPDEGRVFLFNNDSVLLCGDGSRIELPTVAALKSADSSLPPLFFFGKTDDGSCLAGSCEDGVTFTESGRFSFVSLRRLVFEASESYLQPALSAIHLSRWHRVSRFCGSCGAPTEFSQVEPAKVCTACGQLFFPKISPAVIVAVVRDNRILLGHSGRFPGKFYSVLAGFVEPGETLETCVEREVKEEAGIDVDSVTYFGSDPWPFPDSLMIGFTARYAGGTIKVDGKELLHADWFSADSLPSIPKGKSISRRLIDWFIQTEGGR